jgi:hypothetical protein
MLGNLVTKVEKWHSYYGQNIKFLIYYAVTMRREKKPDSRNS